MVSVASLLLAFNSHAWVNLDFDSAITNSITTPPSIFGDGFGHSSEMLHGWTATMGGQPLEGVGLNEILPGNGYATLFNVGNHTQGATVAVEGQYSLLLIPGSQALEIRQRGIIPIDAKAILFSTQYSLISLYLDDANIPLTVSSSFGDWGYPGPRTRSVAIGDISAFSGQEVDLRFYAKADPILGNQFWMDSISFSTEAIPEPSTLVLLGLGGFALIWRCKGSRA